MAEKRGRVGAFNDLSALFQNEWTEAVDTNGRGGAAGADGDGG